MTLKKTMQRLTLFPSSEKRLGDLFCELRKELDKLNKTSDRYREDEAKDNYRKISRSIYHIVNNESDYKIVICDILSNCSEVVAYPKTTDARKFRFRF